MQKHSLLPGRVARLRSAARYCLALAGLLLCAFAAIGSGRAGISRWLAESGSAPHSLAAATRAVEFAPADPEAHYNQALRLAEAGESDQAIAALERAQSLRPADYFFWQELGRAREESGDINGAAFALRQAIALAPAYAQPHWQLGNLLLRSGEPNQAFAELRLAAKSDPAFFNVLIDLAWGVFDSDPDVVLTEIQPQGDAERISVARLFIRHQQINAGMNLVRVSAQIPADERRALVAELLAKQEFPAAQRVWLSGLDLSSGGVQQPRAGVFDGGFEAAINSDNQGFGWLPTQATQTVHLALDPNEPRTGGRSLRVEYSGNFESAAPVISQLVLLVSHTRYRLTFAARTENLVSAALPVIAVSDAKSKQLIAQTIALAAGTNGWREFSIDFETPQICDAVVIRIQRQSCAVQPCPIFGRAWYDSFDLQAVAP